MGDEARSPKIYGAYAPGQKENLCRTCWKVITLYRRLKKENLSTTISYWDSLSDAESAATIHGSNPDSRIIPLPYNEKHCVVYHCMGLHDNKRRGGCSH